MTHDDTLSGEFVAANSHDVAVTAPAGAISRRRVVQGALWAAPVVLVATALPAAAASGVGTLVAGSGTQARGGSNNARHLRTGCIVTYSALATNYPVTGLTLTISVPNAHTRGTNTAATIAPGTSTGWSVGTRTNGTPNDLFTFTYGGLAIGGVTTALVARIPMENASFFIDGWSVTMTATGTSAVGAVPAGNTLTVTTNW